MKICLFSKFGQSSNLLYLGVRFGLEQLKIPYLDINISQIKNESSPYWVSIPTLTPEKPQKIDQEILKKIANFQPDYIFLLQYSGCQFLLNNGVAIRKILGAKGKIIFWLVDLAEKILPNKKLGEFIDFFFLSNEGQINDYKRKWGIEKIYFMPQGCFYAKQFPKNIKKIYNIGFLGRRQREDKRYNQRNEVLDAIKTNCGLKENDKSLSLSEQIDFYQKCKIVVGLSWRNDVYLYSSDRIFNALGAGSFYLCSYFPGIEKIFVNKKHLTWFKTINEALELIDYYLKNEKEREKIAYGGYLLAKQKHNYPERLKNIIMIIKGKTNNFSGFL